MTVAELITQLQTCYAEDEVYAIGPDAFGSPSVSEVERQPGRVILS